jgi:hypothetical protein
MQKNNEADSMSIKVENLEIPNKNTPGKELFNQLNEFLNPSEETLYKSHFKRDFWSLEEFCALINGISPEKYKKILKNPKDENITELDLKCCLAASKLCNRFFQEYKQNQIVEKIQIIEGEIYMSHWKFIKWIASNDIPIKVRFFQELPLYLGELYLEFSPINSPFRTQSKQSRMYHEALYLKIARELIGKYPHRLSREQIYNHPRMQNVLRQIRDLGGNYKKRTITDSWLTKLEERKRGRPKKNTPQSC